MNLKVNENIEEMIVRLTARYKFPTNADFIVAAVNVMNAIASLYEDGYQQPAAYNRLTEKYKYINCPNIENLK